MRWNRRVVLAAIVLAFAASCPWCADVRAQEVKAPGVRSVDAPAETKPPAGWPGDPFRPWGESSRPLSSSQQRNSGPLPAEAPIGVGDVLQISEFSTPSIGGSVRVDSGGNVSLPLVGEVHLQGLTQREAEKAIAKKLVDAGMIRDPQVSVFVSLFATQDISILGEVAHPGVYPYGEHHSLLDLVAAAGGLSPIAGREITVYRRDDPQREHPLTVELAAAYKGVTNLELAAGDTVIVRKAALVYVVGDVARPGGFPLDPSEKLTAVQAMSLAWGAGQYAGLSKARLIRQSENGRTQIALDLKRILDGQDTDVVMQDRDILYIPRSGRSALADRAMTGIVQAAVGAVIYGPLYY